MGDRIAWALDAAQGFATIGAVTSPTYVRPLPCAAGLRIPRGLLGLALDICRYIPSADLPGESDLKAL